MGSALVIAWFFLGVYSGGFLLALALARQTEDRPFEVVMAALLWPSVFWK